MSTYIIKNNLDEYLEIREFGVVLDPQQEIELYDVNRAEHSEELSDLISKGIIEHIISDITTISNAFCEISEINSTGSIIQPTLASIPWKTATLKCANICEFKQNETTSASQIIIKEAGTYRISFNATISCNTTNKFYFFTVYKNGESTDYIQVVKSSGLNNLHYPSVTFIEPDLSPDDYYEIYFTASSDTDTFTLYNMSFIFDRISV